MYNFNSYFFIINRWRATCGHASQASGSDEFRQHLLRDQTFDWQKVQRGGGQERHVRKRCLNPSFLVCY